jgi:(R,R)-butanediol dehydrogenase / meso-butanediol dehydrogenase / diacetyl reductase
MITVSFLHMGGMPLGPGGQMTAVPLGHEPAGEVVESEPTSPA